MIESNKKTDYDIAIVGGGLAGLALSILMAKEKYKVILFEKEKYPFHKVCGEYISMESKPFLERLGLPLDSMNLPFIKNLIVTAPSGASIKSKLDMGGFGISRYKLDEALKNIAEESGVKVLEETKVSDVIFARDFFTIQFPGGEVSAATVAGAYGKRSNLDVKWKRDFTSEKPGKLNNYIGVKYHVNANLPPDTIGLHNFENGYCGISQIENNQFCLCYMTTADNLKKNNNSIAQMEKQILYKNPFLKKIFTTSEFLFDKPFTISQISFDQKPVVENHVLMMGDAAGMITPLCGNGMSMALHASRLAFINIHAFLQGEIKREEMEDGYAQAWHQQFSRRLKMGRLLQRYFGKTWVTNLFITTLKPFGVLIRKIIKATHGREF
ncbi:MAG: NAD(P)/FAD-dependent oxidoreductase [Ginsengibacter sp.]